MKQLIEYWPILSTLFSGLALWAIWSIRSGLVSRKEWQEANKRIGERLGSVEVQVAGLPSREAVDKLAEQMSRLGGDVREMSGKMEIFSQQAQMLFSHRLVG